MVYSIHYYLQKTGLYRLFGFYKGIKISDINFYFIIYILSYFGIIFLFQIIFMYFAINYKPTL